MHQLGQQSAKFMQFYYSFVVDVVQNTMVLIVFTYICSSHNYKTKYLLWV